MAELPVPPNSELRHLTSELRTLPSTFLLRGFRRGTTGSILEQISFVGQTDGPQVLHGSELFLAFLQNNTAKNWAIAESITNE